MKGSRPLTQEEKEQKERAKQQRLQIEDLEQKARYWEAQWKIRFYTLEAEKLQEEYDIYLAAQRKMQQEAMEKFQKEMASMIDKKAEELDAKEIQKVMEETGKTELKPV